ncbi:uncharacterized protein IWZ02DRAFT_458333, partial [Phyllosticta citriasiana]|uniref:uncharacterized protein n=1 Tax=Phyllosticta citriasiana TaxID=595635 RepID=UPI0030FD7541
MMSGRASFVRFNWWFFFFFFLSLFFLVVLSMLGRKGVSWTQPACSAADFGSDVRVAAESRRSMFGIAMRQAEQQR